MPTIKPLNLKILLLAFVACLFFTLAEKAQAATYYVAPNGNDSNPGTLAQPWATLNKANSVIAAGTSVAARGDTVMARGGTYTFGEQTLTKPYTTWQAYPGETPVIDGAYTRPVANPTTVVYSALVSVQMAHGLILDGFTIKRSTGRCLRVFGNSASQRINGAIVKNCSVTDAYDNALLVTFADGVIVEDTEIARGSYEVFAMCGGNWGCCQNKCDYIGGWSGRIDPAAACITHSSNSVWRRCNIHDNYLEAYGDYFCGNNNTIEYSTFYGNFKTNIYLSGANNITARHNLIYGIYPNANNQTPISGGIMIVNEWLPNPSECPAGVGDDFRVYGNMVANCTSSFSLDAYAADRVFKNMKIYNNSFLYPTGTWNVAIGPNSGTGHRFQNNLIAGSGTNGIAYSKVSLAAVGNNLWSAASSQVDANLRGAGDIYAAVPTFAKTTGWNSLSGGGLSFNDFKLQAGSPGINAGTALGAPYNSDYFGTARPQGSNWDIGAHEYTTGSNPTDTTPPNAPSGLAVL